MNKKILSLILCGITAASLLTGCGKETSISDSDISENGVSQAVPPENVDIANYTAPEIGDTIIEMDIKDYGTVKFRLFPEYAEKGTENFIELAKKGYYDGLTFHRVISDFMIQGGDPNGDGTGGESAWGGNFDGGTDPHLIHLPGAVAYANSETTATDGSQFYIVTGEPVITDELFANYEAYNYAFSDNQKEMYKQFGGVPHLDGGYTVFGQVFDGLDIIFKLQYSATDYNDKPLSDIIVDAVRVSEYNGEDLKWKISDYDYTAPIDEPVVNFTPPEKGDEIVVMNIKDYGTVKIRLFPEYIPQGSENFLELARSGYYDGLTFHRVINDFMIQGGDPLGNGTGGESIWGDKFDGGTFNRLIHAAGAVAYANSGATSTNGSQFYIVTGTVYDDAGLENIKASGNYLSENMAEVYKTVGGTPFLDGSYTVFGQVIDGLDIIFKIQQVSTDVNDMPLDQVIIDSVTVEKYDGSDIKWYLSDYSGDSDKNADDKKDADDKKEADDDKKDSDNKKKSDSDEKKDDKDNKDAEEPTDTDDSESSSADGADDADADKNSD